MSKEPKTPEYTRKAIAAYQSKFERININLPIGTKDRIKAAGQTVNGLANKLILEYLEAQEKEK